MSYVALSRSPFLFGLSRENTQIHAKFSFSVAEPPRTTCLPHNTPPAKSRESLSPPINNSRHSAYNTAVLRFMSVIMLIAEILSATAEHHQYYWESDINVYGHRIGCGKYMVCPMLIIMLDDFPGTWEVWQLPRTYHVKMLPCIIIFETRRTRSLRKHQQPHHRQKQRLRHEI